MACSSGNKGGQKRKALNRHENVGHNVKKKNSLLSMPCYRSNHSVLDHVSLIMTTIDANNNKDLSALLLLLNKGANVHERFPFRDLTALHLTNLCNVVYLLFEFGADINAIDVDGNTPLQLAAKLNNWEVTEALLILGAWVDVSNTGPRFVSPCIPNYWNENNSGCIAPGGICRRMLMDDPSLPPVVIELASFADMYNEDSLFSNELKNNIKELMIKFKQAGYRNDLTNLMISRDGNASDGFDSQCSLEVEKMKKVIFRNFNLYDVLMKGPTECSYAANNELCDAIESEQFVQDFPLYHSILRSHLRIAKRRLKFLDEAVYSFDKCLKESKFVQLPTEMYEMVFSYLSSSELIQLNRALNQDFVVTWD